ncbi:MAG: gliding motility lipoprotein GldH [Prevotella sp.]|jgi:gliding motility-associated lipoprotein GldH|nr:gliding motility lipoprotein GldH [Prevotella sp.]
MENRIKRSLKHKALLVLCGALLIIIHISCDKQEVYYRFQELKDAEWARHDTLFFDVDSASFEINKRYNLTIEVSNNVNYPYRNIWIFMQSNINSDSVYTDMSKEFQLADEFGKWNGSGFGTIYQTSLSYGTITFKEKRDYRIKLEHGMRDEPLKGIEKVGIRISNN